MVYDPTPGCKTWHAAPERDSPSGGLSQGVAYVYSDILENRQASYNIRKDQFIAEYQRIQDAKESVRRQLFDSAKRIKSTVSKDVADIFIAQESMLVDPQLVDDLRQTLKQRDGFLLSA